jgi:hypothetical protein
VRIQDPALSGSSPWLIAGSQGAPVSQASFGGCKVIFKKGDLVKVKPNSMIGSPVGIIQAVFRDSEICGPDGDFFTMRHYNVLVNGIVTRFHQDSLILVSRS